MLATVATVFAQTSDDECEDALRRVFRSPLLKHICLDAGARALLAVAPHETVNAGNQGRTIPTRVVR